MTAEKSTVRLDVLYSVRSRTHVLEGWRPSHQPPPLTRVEAGSNTFTVTLRFVGGDEYKVSDLRV
jgi:hypothetical protein